MKKSVIFLLSFIAIFIFIFPQNFSNVRIFLWDNDNGLTFKDPDNPDKYIGYEENLRQSFEILGFSKDSHNLDINSTLPPINELLQYGAVFITCGPRPALTTIISQSDIDKLKEYLDSGGCLYLEGNNIADYLDRTDKNFLNLYFNNYLLYSGGANYSYVETVYTDTTSNFCRYYEFVYPAGTAPDYSIDQLGNFYGLGEPYYYPFLVFNAKGKLYRSTATAYTPPESKAPYYFPGKTVMQTTDFGAYAFPYKQGKDIPDSMKNILIRTSYLRDILRFFSIGRTLVIQDDGQVAKATYDLLKALDNNGIEYFYINLKPTGTYPNYTFLSKFTTVILYTGEYGEPFVLPNDTFNLQRYLTYGGNILVSGENLAQSYGVPGQNLQTDEFPFLAYFLWIDYRSSIYDDVFFTADKTSFYSLNPYTSLIQQVEATSSKVDYVMPFPRDTFVKVNYFLGKSKAPVYVGVNNIAKTHKSVFFGFPIEYIDYKNLDQLIKETFSNFFDYDLDFNLTRTNETSQKDIITKEKEEKGKIYFSGNKIILENINSAKLVDCNGKILKTLSRGENDLNGLRKTGMFFVIFKENNTYKSIKLLKF